MRTTEMVLFAHFLKTSKFISACISIYILSLRPTYSKSLKQRKQVYAPPILKA